MEKFTDLIGQRFGRLVVMEKAETERKPSGQSKTMWFCKCDCGNETIVQASNLKNGNTRSCGCYKKERISETQVKNLIGKKFNNLLVIKKVFAPENTKDKSSAYWLCKCDCGKEKIVSSQHLIKGYVICCGQFCMEHPKKIESAKNRIYNAYKLSAIKRNLIFSLNKEDFLKTITQNCFYCGAEPFNKMKVNGVDRYIFYNGIDRINNKKGYTVGNIVPCCPDCNHAKSNKNIENFYEWIERAYQYSILNKKENGE